MILSIFVSGQENDTVKAINIETFYLSRMVYDIERCDVLRKRSHIDSLRIYSLENIIKYQNTYHKASISSCDNSIAFYKNKYVAEKRKHNVTRAVSVALIILVALL